MLATILKYKKQLITAVVVVIVLLVIWYWWSKKSASTIKVVDDNGHAVSFTPEQTAQAKAIAKRVYDDLNSGWLFGNNFFGTVTRDDEAYKTLAQMSDSMFALTIQTYNTDFKSSLITDLRAESSLGGRDYTAAILDKATRLNIA